MSDRCPSCGASPGSAHDLACPMYNNVVTVAPKNKTVRVVLSSTSYVDFEAPAGFNLLDFVTNIRATGHWLNETLYVPATEIKGIFLWKGDAPPVEGNIIPFKPGA